MLVEPGRAVGSREDVAQEILEEEEEQKKGSNEPLLGKVAKRLARIYWLGYIHNFELDVAETSSV